MENNRNCDVCGNEMYKIGPFARARVEGQPDVKFDGIHEYQCINNQCSENEKIVKFSTDEEWTRREKMSEVCNCGHVRRMHGYSLAGTQDDNRTYSERKDKECAGTDCPCEAFTPKE